MLYVYTVLILTYLGKRAARGFMHKCIFFGACFLTGIKKPALGRLLHDVGSAALSLTDLIRSTCIGWLLLL